MLVLPAGTGHRRATPRDGFSVVGAYPPGQEDYDLLREDLSDAELEAARERIAALGPPPQDPVGGEGVGNWVGPSSMRPLSSEDRSSTRSSAPLTDDGDRS